MSSTSQDAAFFARFMDTSFDHVSDSTRHVLEKYSKIPPDQVMNHVLAIRDKAWAVHPYPCIGSGRFTDLALGNHILYSEVLQRMKTGAQTYLDLGCAFAQDIRRLVADGVDSHQCYGSDLRLELIDFGYELFRDRSTLRSEFIAADIFDPSSPLKDFEGKLDIIGASSFFHLFSWNEQKQIACSVTKLLKPQKDSLLLGRQTATNKPGEYGRPGSAGGPRYRHNLESWRRLWTEVGNEYGVTYEVQGRPVKITGSSAGAPKEEAEGVIGMLEFSVRRLT